MVSLSSLCVLFILSLSAWSAPIPNPQNTVSAPDPLQTQSLEVVTAAELTIPSQGGTFTDFKAIPSTGQGTANATVVRELGASRLVNREPIPEEYRRFFIHGPNGGGGGGGGCQSGLDCFEAVAPPPPKDKGKGKAKPPKKGAKSPPALAPPKAAQGD